MATILLIVIYIGYIGLGIPDSLFGAAWPAVYEEFHIPVSYAGFVTAITSVCTMISSLISARVINRFGTDMGTQMAAAYVGIMLTPPLVGIMADELSHAVFPYYLAVMLGLLAAASAKAFHLREHAETEEIS